MIVACLERLLNWLNRKSGCFTLREPIIIQHGDSWLRIAPDETPQWFRSEWQAMA
jgi:hypothetical protein